HHHRGPLARPQPSVAAGLDCRAGAAVRLLPIRDADDRGRAAGPEAEAHGRGHRRQPRRPHLPLRDLPAHPPRGASRRRGPHEGGRAVSTRRTFLKAGVTGGAALVVGFHLQADLLAQAPPPERKPPNPFDAWIHIDTKGTVTLITAKS